MGNVLKMLLLVIAMWIFVSVAGDYSLAVMNGFGALLVFTHFASKNHKWQSVTVYSVGILFVGAMSWVGFKIVEIGNKASADVIATHTSPSKAMFDFVGAGFSGMYYEPFALIFGTLFLSWFFKEAPKDKDVSAPAEVQKGIS